MSGPIHKPHLLIASDPILVGRLCGSCSEGEKPFVLTANPNGTWRGETSESHRIGVSLETLIRLKLHNGADRSPELELEQSLRTLRTHFGLSPGDPIRVAMAGTHSSLSGMMDGAHFHQGINADRSKRTSQEDAMRKGRTLVGLLEATFAKLGYFQPIWLTDAFPELRPKPVRDRYVQLAKTARDLLADIEIPPFSGAGVRLRQPALPLIFVTRDPVPADPTQCDEAEWEPLAALDRDHPFSVTQKLISQFGRQRIGNPQLRGVLVKLLPVDLSNQNPFDAPMVGQSTIELAHWAGIESILLDARRGVLRPPLDEGVRTVPVFGIPPA